MAFSPYSLSHRTPKKDSLPPNKKHKILIELLHDSPTNPPNSKSLYSPKPSLPAKTTASFLRHTQLRSKFYPPKPSLPTKTTTSFLRHTQLRSKFLKSALDCLGIPYGRKYLRTHPEYSSNLFLDCCGLVRYAFNKIKHEFGFSLGGGNQCYQYDLLPPSIKFNQLKPGDLIFYTGTYYPDKGKRQQLHNVVHVEIYLGEGEKTIGSRDSSGVVSIYDTFQFESETYYNIEYHFKSIDTWLRGIKKSFCKEHNWDVKTVYGKSIYKKIKYEDIILNQYKILKNKQLFQQLNLLQQKQLGMRSKSGYSSFKIKLLTHKKKKAVSKERNSRKKRILE